MTKLTVKLLEKMEASLESVHYATQNKLIWLPLFEYFSSIECGDPYTILYEKWLKIM